MSVFRDEDGSSPISLEEFKWNLKRLLHECYPDGFFLHDIEEAYYHWFRKMVSPSAFANHSPLGPQNDMNHNHKSSDWKAVFKAHFQLRQAFIVETIEEDIYKVKLRPGCIKPEENKIILALTEYSNCTAYIRGHFSQNRANEETESTFLQITKSSSSRSNNNCDGAKGFVDVSVQAEMPEASQDLRLPSPISPTKMDTDEPTTSSPSEISITTAQVPSASVSLQLPELCNGDINHRDNGEPDVIQNANSETLTSTAKSAETATVMTSPAAFSSPENQETHSSLVPVPNGPSDTGENEKMTNTNGIQNERLANENCLEIKAVQNEGLTNENHVDINDIQNEDSGLGLVVQNGDVDVKVSDHIQAAKSETQDQDQQASEASSKTDTDSTGLKAPPVTVSACNGQKETLEESQKMDSTFANYEKKFKTDTTHTIPFKDILVSTPVRKAMTGSGSEQQTKHRCTYLGCSHTFDNLKERNYHIIVAHALNGLKFKCQVDGCKKLFRTREAMLQHSAKCSREPSGPCPTEEVKPQSVNGTGAGTGNWTFGSSNSNGNGNRDHHTQTHTQSVFGVRYVEPEGDDDEDEDHSDFSDVSLTSSSKKRKLEFPKRCSSCDTIIENSVAMNLHLHQDH